MNLRNCCESSGIQGHHLGILRAGRLAVCPRGRVRRLGMHVLSRMPITCSLRYQGRIRIQNIRSAFLSLAAGARMLFPGLILTDVLIDPFIFAPFTFGQKFSAAYIRTIIASGQCNN